MELKAGRELDALVAEKVMEWTITYGSSGESWEPGDNGRIWSTGFWSPSTNMSDAWVVVEKMNRDGFSFALESGSDGGAGAVFGKDGYIGDDLSGPRATFEESAPLAICQAALKAVGQPIKESIPHCKVCGLEMKPFGQGGFKCPECPVEHYP